ncbi:MAG TPA: hypothetical protein VKY59_00480 [Spirillospora sp.]|nr:hypothetical protein [Spirillospora sp.]
MAKKGDTSGVLKALASEEPLVLVGESGRIRGKLNLTNTSSEEVVLQDALLRTLPVKGARGKETPAALEINKPLHPIIMRPGRSRSVSLKMTIDPYTPPGEYDAQLEIGGETKPVKVHVVEKVDLSLHPDRLVIREAPGGTVTRRIVIQNKGNVPLVIGEIGAVPLEDERLECRILRRVATAINTEAKAADFEDHFRTAMAQIQGVIQQAGALRVHNNTGTVTIAPGGAQAIDLEIQLPESLDRRTRYTALVPIYSRNLMFEIAPILGDQPTKNTR